MTEIKYRIVLHGHLKQCRTKCQFNNSGEISSEYENLPELLKKYNSTVLIKYFL
jgi:hypothetical protein